MNKSNLNVLYQLGFSPTEHGFWYIVAALRIIYQDPESLTCLTKCIYAAVADECHVTTGAVESALRRGIARCWRQNRYFLETILMKPLAKPPTVGQFLAALALYLLRGEGN